MEERLEYEDVINIEGVSGKLEVHIAEDLGPEDHRMHQHIVTRLKVGCDLPVEDEVLRHDAFE